MKRWMVLALLSCAAVAHAQTSQAKKDLVAKLLQLQQPGIENIARQIVERPAAQLMQQAGTVLQTQVPADKRQATAKTIEADVKKYIDEATPLMRDRAIKLAPSTIGVVMEEKFTEDELKQLIAWSESPVIKKYQQLGGELQTALGQKLVAEAPGVLDPRLQALQQKMGDALRSAAGKPAPQAAKPPAKPASK
ncbi:MAG TPA: DUF2059 domain-containing protein [Albitalea sp.]|nr:DUF2059 domain-containing protein [Albitalea sp.]